MNDDSARGEAGDLTQQIDAMLVQAEPVDWAHIEALAEQLAAVAWQGESGREPEEHLLTITFKPTDDDEAALIIEKVEALGFEIVRDREVRRASGGVVGKRTPEALKRRGQEEGA